MPNLPVDLDSWGRSACYPRSTFYLLSDGASTRNRRITKTYFRTCSTYKSRSQAPLYLYALLTIADRDEGTFVLLRYLLGGDRPSQTTHLALSRHPIQGDRLDAYNDRGGISRMAPRELALPLQSLPPILHIPGQAPILGYSQGSRGLSV